MPQKKNKEEEDYLSRFQKVYSNLPLKERENPVVVLDDEPISWKMAWREIKNETETGKRIAKILIKLDII